MDTAKIAVGKKAASLITDGQIVGLGSGTTAIHFIQSLIERTKQGLKIKAVSSSRASAEAAKKGGIEVLDINGVSHIDVTVDGADEVDPEKRMIKGGGGAHVREKILSRASKKLIIIIDESKLVPKLGRHPLPVEILFYGSTVTRGHIEKLGFMGHWRLNPDQTLFLSDNGNLIFDIHFTSPPHAPERVDAELRAIPGVVDTGFFFNLPDQLIIGYKSGKVEVQ